MQDDRPHLRRTSFVGWMNIRHIIRPHSNPALSQASGRSHCREIPLYDLWLSDFVGRFGRSSSMAMFIRVKRKKTTYFLHCDPSETVAETKHKLHALSDVPVDQQRLILLPAHAILDDAKTLADQKVENDAVVALTLKIVDTGEWEEVTIEKPADHANLIDPDLN